jgi:hypothetical protein
VPYSQVLLNHWQKRSQHDPGCEIEIENDRQKKDRHPWEMTRFNRHGQKPGRKSEAAAVDWRSAAASAKL